jgi:hypothetical protein
MDLRGIIPESMPSRVRGAVAALLVAGAGATCSRPEEPPPVATPSLTLSAARAPIGSPIDLTYRFAVAPDAPPFGQDYWVFVHFLDSENELMWTDDHQPPTPTRNWKPGTTIEYQRTMFIPKFPYVGEARIEVGLFSPESGERVPMAGTTSGQRSYEVATLDLHLESDSVFVVFRDGWHDTEIAEGAGREWQWTRQNATLSFRNPKRNIRFFLQADQPAPAAFDEPQEVEIRIGETVVERFAMAPDADEVQRIDIPAVVLGSGETVDIVISVDRTFVPAAVAALKSTDPRELGIRVFRAFVQPM